MPKKITKKERLQREYNRQIKRIAKRLEQLDNQGYNTEYAQSKVEVVPKRITDATIRRLKSITPKWIRSHSSYEDYHTGEIVQPKSKAARKYLNQVQAFEADIPTGNENWGGDFAPAPSVITTYHNTNYDEFNENIYSGDDAARLIIDNFYDEISDFPASWVAAAHEQFDAAIEEYGIQHVADALQSMPESFHFFVSTHKFPSDDYVEMYYNEFLEYLDLSPETYFDIESDSESLDDDT